MADTVQQNVPVPDKGQCGERCHIFEWPSASGQYMPSLTWKCLCGGTTYGSALMATLDEKEQPNASQ